MNDIRIDLASVPLTDFSQPEVGKSNLWEPPFGQLIKNNRSFGQTSMFDPNDDCWRKLVFGLHIPQANNGTRRTLPDGTWEITATVKTSCGGKCGYLEKRCVCWPPPPNPPPKDDRGVLRITPPCLHLVIRRWKHEHPFCPPLKVCEPNWKVEPLPPGCPPASYDIKIVYIVPANASPQVRAKHLISHVLNAMEGMMDTEIARLAEQGYNFMCDGGPKILPPIEA